MLADTGAGASVFWDSALLSNIRRMETPYRIRGIGGAVINVYMEGDSAFGPVGYHKQSGMNILSIGEILDRCVHIEIDQKDRALVVQMCVDGPVYVFHRVNNQFICNLTTDVAWDGNYSCTYQDKFVGVATVEERMKIFSKAEIARAEEARELQQRMGYPSAGQLIKQLQHGKIETRVTPNDVVNAVYIFGKSIGECKGKTTSRKQEEEKPEPIGFTGVRVNQRLYIDLMFEGKLTFLVMVFKPLEYTYVRKLDTKSAKDIWSAMQKGLREVYNRGFMVTVGYIDGERAAGTDYLQQLVWNNFQFELDITGAAEAVPVVESRIRRIKERVRAVFNTLP